MLNTLINLLEDESFIDAASKLFAKNFANFENAFGVNSFCSTNNTFNEVNGSYEMKVSVGADVTEDNVNIDLDGNVIKIKYRKETDKQLRMFKIIETLPADADLDTLDAKIVDGMLIITADKD